MPDPQNIIDNITDLALNPSDLRQYLQDVEMSNLVNTDSTSDFEEATQYLKEYFIGMIEEGLPGKEKYLETGIDTIQEASEEANENIKETLAARGLSGMFGTNLFNETQEKESEAVNKLQDNITRAENDWKKAAAAQLLNIEESRMKADQNDMVNAYNIAKLLESKRQFDVLRDSEENPFFSTMFDDASANFFGSFREPLKEYFKGIF